MKSLFFDGFKCHLSAPVLRSGPFRSSPAGAPVVVTMAATNRYHCLDEALVRPVLVVGFSWDYSGIIIFVGLFSSCVMIFQIPQDYPGIKKWVIVGK